MKSFKLFVIIALAFFSFSAIAAEGKWIKGYGQGNLEFFTEKGNAKLYIGCPSKESNDGGSSKVLLFVNNKEVNSFKVKVDGNTYNGPFSTGTRSGENSFIEFINNVLKTDAVVTYGKETITFPKSNVSKVLDTYLSGKLACAIN